MDPHSSHVAEYQNRLAARKAKANLLDQRSSWISNLRLVAFLFFVVMVWLAVRGNLAAWWIVVPMAMFAGFVIWHDRVRRDQTRAQRAIHVYEWGIARIHDEWHAFGRKGERFRRPDHVYAEDLDLFGDQSLFQLLSTARTRMGEDTFAGWLLRLRRSLRYFNDKRPLPNCATAWIFVKRWQWLVKIFLPSSTRPS